MQKNNIIWFYKPGNGNIAYIGYWYTGFAGFVPKPPSFCGGRIRYDPLPSSAAILILILTGIQYCERKLYS